MLRKVATPALVLACLALFALGLYVGSVLSESREQQTRYVFVQPSLRPAVDPLAYANPCPHRAMMPVPYAFHGAELYWYCRSGQIFKAPIDE